MPRVSRESAGGGGDYGIVLDQADELDGYAVSFLTFREDIDHTPLLRGLPDDRCQCPHWGYVLSGALTFRFGDVEEVYRAGDAFYAPPGHVPVHNEPGTEYLQFSPAAELQVTSDTIMRNMQSMPMAEPAG